MHHMDSEAIADRLLHLDTDALTDDQLADEIGKLSGDFDGQEDDDEDFLGEFGYMT